LTFAVDVGEFSMFFIFHATFYPRFKHILFRKGPGGGDLLSFTMGLNEVLKSHTAEPFSNLFTTQCQGSPFLHVKRSFNAPNPIDKRRHSVSSYVLSPPFRKNLEVPRSALFNSSILYVALSRYEPLLLPHFLVN